MLQIVTFAGNSDDLRFACNMATAEANAFILENRIPFSDITSSLQHSQTVVDGITWHYAAVTLELDANENVVRAIKAITEKVSHS